MVMFKELQAIGRIGMAALLAMGLLSCTSNDLGEGLASGGAGTTTISGKVSLPAVLANKPGYKAEMLAKAAHGKPDSPGFKPSSKVVAGYGVNILPSNAATLDGAEVELYSALHPEWVYPVAYATTDNTGNFTLSTLINATNNGGAYIDGEPLPAGNYTLLAKKVDPVTGDYQVAIQNIVKRFSGKVIGTDLIAQPSDAEPKVMSIVGAKKNTDGTNTWGDDTSPKISKNSAVQVVFSMAMSRLTIINGGISIKHVASNTQVKGVWSISADWTTATFYPESVLDDGLYTVTVAGGSASNLVRNIYENPLKDTAVGKFVVENIIDTVKPTGIIISPDATNVELTSAIRIAANELLDVNGILLSSSPSFGDQPTVHYLGKNDALAGQYKYVYEFIPSDPLKLNTDYDITISGARDLAGNAMRSLNFSFGTVADAVGVDASAAIEIQSLQADVLSVFGKWTNAMNEHNLAALQSTMSGEFVLEYDVTTQGLNSEDVNKDGRFSMAEFSNLIEDAFLNWEYCGTTITGSIDELINVDQTAGIANLAFHLSALSTNTSRECQDAAPNDPFFMSLRLQNGAWQIERASQGIDTRDKTLQVRDYIRLVAPVDGSVNSDPITPTLPNSVLSFDWEAPNNSSVSSYIFVFWNENQSNSGRAYAVKSLFNSSIELGVDNMAGNPYVMPNADIIDVSAKFGYYGNTAGGEAMPGAMKLNASGESFRWTVLGMGKNTFDDFKNNRAADIFRDIVAISPTSLFTNPGQRQMITPQVVITATDKEVTFSEYIWGYDAGSNGRITLNLHSTMADTLDGSTGMISVSGHMWASYPVTFDANGNGSVTFDLYKGMNWISFDDGAGLWSNITVVTSGGIPPIMQVTNVTTNNGLSLIPDAWGYISALGAKSITINGTVSDPSMTSVDMWLWNQNGAYKNKTVSVTSGAFSVTVDIYQGDNWIGLSGSTATTWASSYLGVYTDTGSVYVPPIALSGVTSAVMTDNYGSNSNWDASGDADNKVTVSGKFNEILDLTNSPPSYSFSSDGGWWSGNLNVLPDGTFTLDIPLYNGWTWVSINDGVGHWYGLNLYTSAGVVVYRPKISSVDGIDVSTFSGAITDCTANIVGTAEPSSLLTLYWYGYDGNTSYSESSTVMVDSSGNFSVAVPVVSNIDPLISSYNYIDLYDRQWRWAGTYVSTSALGCGWSSPSNSINSASDGNEVISSLNFVWNPDWLSWQVPFTNTATSTATFKGTHNRANRIISATVYDSCGGAPTYTTQAGPAGGWSLANMPMYNGWNDIYITDGYTGNEMWYGINSTSANLPPQKIGFSVSGLTSTANGCNWSDWDVGTAATVDITVTTSGTQNGQGTLYTDQGAITLTFTNGVATATGVKVYGMYPGSTTPGAWNYFTVYDPDWNIFYPYVWSTNNTLLPKYIGVISPAHNSTITAGTVTVTAGWDTTKFNPDYLYAYVEDYDNITGSWIIHEYSNDGWYMAFKTVDNDPTSPSYGTFSFDVPLSGSDNAYIYVYGSSWTSNQSHANGVTLNNTVGYNEWWYKPAVNGKPAKQKSTLQGRRSAEKALKAEKAARNKHTSKLH